jgi:hypothetical protein
MWTEKSGVDAPKGLFCAYIEFWWICRKGLCRIMPFWPNPSLNQAFFSEPFAVIAAKS